MAEGNDSALEGRREIEERARNHLRALEEHEGSCSCADCNKHAESAEIIEALLSQPKDQASPGDRGNG
jgi:hypothetical protein